MSVELVLASTARGRVLDHGAPVVHAQVVRTWRWAWNGRTGRDVVWTDGDGRFILPAVTGRSWLAALLPHEPYVFQEVNVHREGQEFLAWQLAKRNYEPDGERHHPLRVVCHLDRVPGEHRGAFGICEDDPAP